MSVPGKAVVTGASGLIGRELVDLLVNEGIDVVAIDKMPLRIGGIKSVVVDLCDAPKLERWLDSDTIVFHLATSADVGKSVAEPRHDFANTLYAFFEVLESARATGARVIFPSTASVYDPAAPLPLDERSAKSPSSPYAAAKLAGEAYSIAYHRAYGTDVRIARMFSVYGPRMTRLAIHDIIRKLDENPAVIDLLGDGSQVRDYLHVRDAARGLYTIATLGTPGEDYNLASGVPTTIIELTRVIASLMGCGDVSIRPTGKSFPGDTSRWYAGIEKIRGIGFEPEIPLEAGLAETIAAVRARSIAAGV